MPMLSPDPPPPPSIFFSPDLHSISGMTKKSGKTAEIRVSAEKFKACVCVSVCLFALCRLNRWTYGPKIWRTH